MKTIVVSMLQEHGHLNPSFKVNRTLQARGWTVKYLGILDFEEYIRSQGFELVPYFPDIFPRGFIQSQDKLGFVAHRRALTSRFQEITDRLLDPNNNLRRRLIELAPSAMIVDINLTQHALLAHQLRIPTVTMNVTLPQTKDPGVPPLRTSVPYGRGLRARAQSELAWRKLLAKRKLGAVAADIFGMCPQFELARRSAPRFGYPSDRLDCDTIYMPRLIGTPELILCPDGFDFPRPELAERHYVESIDLDRKEVEFPWERVDVSKPLVYVAMGSQRFQTKHVRRFFQTAIDALGARPELQVVVALGRHLEPEEIARPPANVVVVKSAPQLSILRRAKLMVTHGGLGSVKECIIYGVPMIVFPLAVDQPGNAARVAHHGLGLAGDVRKATKDGLLEAIDRVLREPSFAARVGELRKRFETTEREHRGADVVESTIARGSLH